MAMKSLCKIDGCDKPARWRGMCGGHYTRWRRHGEAGGPLLDRAANGEPLAYLFAAAMEEEGVLAPDALNGKL